MIVLAESNFVLELALRQEQFDHAERILRLAEEGRVRLVLPAYSLVEPYQTLIRRRSERKDLRRKLQSEIKLLGRSRLHGQIVATSESVAQTLDAGTEIERESLEQLLSRLMRVCDVPALSSQIVQLAQAMQLDYGLEPPDAIVLASIDAVLSELEAGAKVFVNKNSKDFATPLIEGRLEQWGCRLLTSFAAARGYIESELGNRGPPGTRTQ